MVDLSILILLFVVAADLCILIRIDDVIRSCSLTFNMRQTESHLWQWVKQIQQQHIPTLTVHIVIIIEVDTAFSVIIITKHVVRRAKLERFSRCITLQAVPV